MIEALLWVCYFERGNLSSSGIFGYSPNSIRVWVSSRVFISPPFGMDFPSVRDKIFSHPPDSVNVVGRVFISPPSMMDSPSVSDRISNHSSDWSESRVEYSYFHCLGWIIHLSRIESLITLSIRLESRVDYLCLHRLGRILHLSRIESSIILPTRTKSWSEYLYLHHLGWIL